MIDFPAEFIFSKPLIVFGTSIPFSFSSDSDESSDSSDSSKSSNPLKNSSTTPSFGLIKKLELYVLPVNGLPDTFNVITPFA